MRMWHWFSLGIVAGVFLSAAWGFAPRADQPSTRAAELPSAPPDDGKLRIICFGAHPDDCEIRTGGVGALLSLIHI